MDKVSVPLDSSRQNVTAVWDHINEDRNFEKIPIGSHKRGSVGKDIIVSYNRGAVRNPADVVVTPYIWMGEDDGWCILNDYGVLQLYSWIDMSFGKFASRQNFIVAYREYDDDVEFKVKLYTNSNCYSINGFIPRNGSESYMCGFMDGRAPRPGEDWKRGNDLSDGDFSWFTWNNIIGDIISAELVDINHKNVKWGLKPDDGPNEASGGHRTLMRHLDNGTTGETRQFKG